MYITLRAFVRSFLFISASKPQSLGQAFSKACGSRAEPLRFPKAEPLVRIFKGETLKLKLFKVKNEKSIDFFA